MRLLLLALMIALLPLRGWVGDAMAMEMVNEALHPAKDAIKSVASDDHSARHGGHFDAHHAGMAHADCADHAAADSGNPGTDGTLAHGADCASHVACQLCHSAALAMLPLLSAPDAPPAVAPRAALSGFASAEPTPGFKPPIF